MVYSFGHGFYANKKHQEDPSIKSFSINHYRCQVIGGMSKCLKFYAGTPYYGNPGKTVNANNFYSIDSHNDGRGMEAGALNFDFISWEGCGFSTLEFWMYLERDGKVRLVAEGKPFHRKPMFHSAIMKLIEEGKLVSGSKCWYICISNYQR